MWDAAQLRRHRRAILLFVLIVLLPGIAFSVLIVRSVRGEQVQAAQRQAERRRQIVRLVEADLNAWLFSAQGDAASSEALLTFRLEGDHIVFPEFHLRLPAKASPPRPPEAMPQADRPTPALVTDFYYPRILVFLRDFKSGAQYFLRLKALVVFLPGQTQGYVLDAQRVLDHVNRRLAELCTGEPFTGSLWIADNRDDQPAARTDAFTLPGFSFFQVIFYDGGRPTAGTLGEHAFAYAMALLILVTILGTLLVYRTVAQEARLSRLRTDFVSAVSHEFRSPLSSILALSERLDAARVRDASKLAEYHHLIGQEAQRLSVLVTRLLDFAQIEDGNKTYSLDRVELVAVARDAIGACGYAVRENRVRLRGDDAAPLWVRADRMALQQCIQNLIENAAKYSPVDQPITVTCLSSNGTHTVEVHDHGIGIPLDEQSRIFEKFYRGHRASASNVQGAGIGLALVKHVVESHGGVVLVESEPNAGSRFRLRLPRADA